jgi:hypothetical protein
LLFGSESNCCLSPSIGSMLMLGNGNGRLNGPTAGELRLLSYGCNGAGQSQMSRPTRRRIMMAIC